MILERQCKMHFSDVIQLFSTKNDIISVTMSENSSSLINMNFRTSFALMTAASCASMEETTVHFIILETLKL